MNDSCPLHAWFELSYASWITLPRVLMQEMPLEWRKEMAKLLEQFDKQYPNKLDIGTRVQFTDSSGKICKGPKWLNNYRHPDYKEINKMIGPNKRPAPLPVSSKGTLKGMG